MFFTPRDVVCQSVRSATTTGLETRSIKAVTKALTLSLPSCLGRAVFGKAEEPANHKLRYRDQCDQVIRVPVT